MRKLEHAEKWLYKRALRQASTFVEVCVLADSEKVRTLWCQDPHEEE